MSLWCSGQGIACTACRSTGSTPGDRDAVFCFLVVPFFVCLVSGFDTIFPFGLFSFILTSDFAGHALGSSIKLKSGVVFWERDFKSS